MENWKQKKNTHGFKKAFTLIELMVVIAIIAIMAGVVLINLKNTAKKGDTAKAIADLTDIRGALESYKSDNGSYPDTGGNWVSYCTVGNKYWIPALQTDYFTNGVPIEPASDKAGSCVDSNVQYVYKSDRTNFKLKYRNAPSKDVPSAMIDPSDAASYGYWSPGGSAF